MTSKKKWILFKFIEVVCLFTPMIILLGIRWDNWISTNVSVVEVSIGLISFAVVCALLMLGYAKKVKGIVWCAVALFITYFLRTIMNDLYMILFCALIGLIVSYPFKILSINNYEVYKIVRDEFTRTRARKEAEKEISGE